MAKVYFVRHQVAGILTDYPFAAYPSDAQQGALAAMCLERHGTEHTKTKEPLWLRVVELEMLGPGELPKVPDAGSRESSAALPGPTVSAVGTVTPKER